MAVLQSGAERAVATAQEVPVQAGRVLAERLVVAGAARTAGVGGETAGVVEGRIAIAAAGEVAGTDPVPSIEAVEVEHARNGMHDRAGPAHALGQRGQAAARVEGD